MRVTAAPPVARPATRRVPGRRTSAAGAPRRFLPEVQALRALAVTLVVVYHFYPAAAPGGFVGVDVFFVISGFLITAHLLREAQATGRIRLPAFWAARIRRIMPAAVVTVTAVVAATLLLWPASQWGEVSRQAVASLLSVENLVLAADAVDYLAADAAPTALQHFWSLGVEEQFYLAWPLLVILAAALTHRRRRTKDAAAPRPRVAPTAAVVFALVVAASLVWSASLVREGDPSAYFLTTARVWELAAGGLLAALLPETGWRAAPRVRTVTALIGVGLLAAVAFGYSDATAFPGLGAVLPVAGTLAVIAAGRTAGPGSLHRLTDSRPVQWIGDASYSLYLWHWPVVIVAAQLLDRRPHWWEAIALIAASIALAGASHRFVEAPARRFRPLASRPWCTILAGVLVTAVAVGIAAVPGVRASVIAHDQAAAASTLQTSPPHGFGAAAWRTAGGAAFVAGTAIAPAPLRAGADVPAWRDCIADVYADVVEPCTFGDATADIDIALVGDSHAGQWIGVLDAIARARHWRLTSYVRNSCPFVSVPRTFERARHTSCTRTNEQTLRTLERTRPDVVLLASWTGSSFVSDPRPGFAADFERLRAAGITPIVIRDTPWGAEDGDVYVRDCVAAHAAGPHACDLDRAVAMHTDGAVDAARGAGVAVIDPVPWICGQSVCPAVVGNVLVWRDSNHISNTYMLTMRPELEHTLSALVPDER